VQTADALFKLAERVDEDDRAYVVGTANELLTGMLGSVLEKPQDPVQSP